MQEAQEADEAPHATAILGADAIRRATEADARFTEAEVDGVTAHVHPSDGPSMIGLVFRVGQADETLTIRGATHLVEHLALHATDLPDLTFNGGVGLLTTTFWARGAPEQLATFFSRLTKSLQDLPPERVRAESGVLRTEAASRDPNGFFTLLGWRYGPTGAGLLGAPELGLEHLEADQLAEWSARWFTRDNAALWVHGAIPPGLHIDLPPGELRAHPTTAPVDQPLPAYANQRSKFVAASMLSDWWSEPTAMALAVLSKRLHDRLRVEEGRAYAITSSFERVDAAHGVMYLTADCLADEAAAVRDGMFGELGRLATSGPTPGEIEDVIRKLHEGWIDPMSVPARLVRRADRQLEGESARPIALALDEISAVTPNAVADHLDDARESLIVLLPGGVGMPDKRLVTLRDAHDEPIGGLPMSRRRSLPDASGRDALLVGDESITLRSGQGNQITIAWRSCIALQRWEDGARTVWHRDGTRIFVSPDEWSTGERLVETIDSHVAQPLWVEMARPAGSAYLDAVNQQQPPPPPPSPLTPPAVAPPPEPQGPPRRRGLFRR